MRGNMGCIRINPHIPIFNTEIMHLDIQYFCRLFPFQLLKVIKLFGDTFDYWLMTFWSLLLICLGLIIQKFYPKVLILNQISLSSVLIVLAFFVFIINMILYIPFTISPSDAPRELPPLF